jgi:nicotinamidase-related amidase
MSLMKTPVFLSLLFLFFCATSWADPNAFYDRQGFSGIVHATDPQWTFLKRDKDPGAVEQKNDGTLPVAGTEGTISKIVSAMKSSVQSGLMKVSISGDAHYMAEVIDPTQNGEFHEPFNFGQHGMKGRPGPDGDRFITEIEQILETRHVSTIEAHAEEIVDGKPKLKPVIVDLNSLRREIADVRTIMHFEKNGVGSYSVFANPNFRGYLEKIDPYKKLTHFHFGWCTDFCDYWVMKEELELGYNVVFIVDAAAGVGAKTTGQRMREMLKLGLKVITTAEYLNLNASWSATRANWLEVNNDIEKLMEQSPTKKRVEEELLHPRYVDPAHPGDLGEACAVLMSK